MITSDLKPTSKKNNLKLISRLKDMFKHLSKGRIEVQPSKMWDELNEFSMKEIEMYGYENFKRTLARHYFANTPLWFMNRQTKFLILNTDPIQTFEYFLRSVLLPTHKGFNWIDAASYNFLTFMIWDYAARVDSEHVLDTFEEPEVGNPPPIYWNNKLISQDLANAVMEYKSVMEEVDPKSIKSMMEIGAGSGRDAHVFITLLPKLERYIIVDIPPALVTSEQYLSDIFPNKKVFRQREFKKFSEIEKEFNNSQIAFFLPHQVELLPKELIDLTINISSFHEMKLRQIKFYFNQIERLTKPKGHLYFKEWKIGGITYEDEVIYTADYPVEPKWETIYLRSPKVQTKFFERLVQLK